MKKSIFLKALAVSAVLVSLDASAASLTLNGKTYKSVSSVTTKCPDGTSAITYQGTKYCSTHVANLSWSAPTKRTDGDILGSIFRVLDTLRSPL